MGEGSKVEKILKEIGQKNDNKMEKRVENILKIASIRSSDF
jgi:hypothetical protein